MTPENTKYLVETYPHLYRETFYFECGDGWFDLLKELSEKLEPLFAPYRERHSCRIVQVKEKFGGLRYYTGFYPSEESKKIEAAIEEAEKKAWVTCEVCGEPGKVRYGGWISTLCNKHHMEGSPEE